MLNVSLTSAASAAASQWRETPLDTAFSLSNGILLRYQGRKRHRQPFIGLKDKDRT
ncbi:hypothetical protein [Rhizobium halophytocola]|uniref:hypothetical protein n=1 Tax=Rhizobium halophytocola TaxID=735519 RepID=UPI001AE86F10|nr:hypothetical protein [Rhizobium halophytocola]